MIDMDALLLPLSDDSPCGADLSFSIELDSIQEARRFDDPTLDQGAWVTDLKEADWQAVCRQCINLLSTQSKDLRLGVWLCEGLAKTSGFEGLGLGYQLLTRLCYTYWDSLHPIIEADDAEQRMGNLRWLVNRTLTLLGELSITHAQGIQYTYADYERALANSRSTKKTIDDKAPASAVTWEQFDKNRHATSRNFYRKLLTDIPNCVTAMDDLEAVVDRHLGTNGPSFSAAKSKLGNILALIEHFASEAGATGYGNRDDSAPASNVHPEIAATDVGIALVTRAQALRQLHEVAAFFKNTEPHSPVAYLAEKAAKWGEMPLHVWLRSVLKDNGSLAHLEELLGITPPAKDNLAD